MFNTGEIDYIKKGFDIDDNHYSIVFPTSLEELNAAMHVNDVLDAEVIRHEPDDGNPFFYLQRVQKEAIEKFIAAFEEFDNSLLVKNILYLTKSKGIGIGTLERILGISAGYISRTAKENSGKRMSIDAVWKISRIFEVSISSLLGTDLSYPNHNTDLTLRFVEQLTKKTSSGEIDWTNMGGVATELDERISSIGFFNFDIIFTDNLKYSPDHLSNEAEFIITRDMYSCTVGNKNLLIVPFKLVKSENYEQYDIYFLEKNKSGGSYYITLAFSTVDDIPGEIKLKVDELYRLAERQQFDMKLSDDAKTFMTLYVE